MKVALFNMNQINRVNIQANKIVSSIDLSELQEDPYNLNIRDAYSPEVIEFL